MLGAVGGVVAGLGAGAGAAVAVGATRTVEPEWCLRRFELDLTMASPYVVDYAGTYEPKAELDGDGIPITQYEGERVYHPVDAGWYLFPQLFSYELDGDAERLDSVLATTEYLLEGAEPHHIDPGLDGDGLPGDRSLWFPYHFAHTPGGLKNGVPWYSGMAQGMMLSHLLRVYEVTGKDEWLDHAHLVFNSFRHYRDGAGRNGKPWFVSFDNDGEDRFTTFEEYPSDDPHQLSHVVNGNIYAMWGVFDYLRVTEDGYARTLLCRALASLLERFDRYRVPGKPSNYGMTAWARSTWGSPENYHRGVITQLRRTAKFSGERTFAEHAALLEQDHS
jgi:hypothetical protein